MKLVSIAAASLLVVGAFGEPITGSGPSQGSEPGRRLNIFDDIGHGIDSLVHGATHGVEKTACDVIKAMDIELPGIDEKVPPTNMMGGLVKFKDGEASTGSLKLSDCTVEDGKAVLGFTATAKLSGGDVSVIGKHFDLPEATLPYSVQLTADICTKFSIPTGIKNMGVKSIEIGDAKVGNHELPQEVIEFANGSLNKYGTTAVNELATHTVMKKNTFGMC